MFATLLMTLFVTAAVPDKPADSAAPPALKEKRICKTFEQTGSRMAVKRICKTEEEWRIEQESNVRDLDELQRRATNN